jgi:hypothetical protein
MAMITFIKACQSFFSAEPFGRHVSVPEFKALTTEDKLDLSAMLQDGARLRARALQPPGSVVIKTWL